jgi:MOSC domain-containing protein YiiM
MAGSVHGRVLRVAAKPRVPGQLGMPKPSVGRARITEAGVEGDHNRYRTERLAGDLDSAVLLMTSEALAQLRAEGWALQAGDIGENLTIEGVPYDAFQPGTRWRIGAVGLQVSRACNPCKNLYKLPQIGDARGPAFVKAMAGRRGWYARVLRAGEVAAGDAVERA